MVSFRMITTTCILLIVCFATALTVDSIEPFLTMENLQSEKTHAVMRGKRDSSSTFKLKDLKGTYIVQGATAGGPGPQSSASVFTLIFDKEGHGFIPFLTIRTFSGTLPSTTAHLPSLQYPTPFPVSIQLNSDGTGELLIVDFPAPNDVTHFDIVLQKENGKVAKGFFVKTGVTGPSVDSDSANEIKLFQMIRQE